MKTSGTIKKTDWKLYACNQETGAEFLLSWGGCEEAHEEMHREADRGHDVWLIDPDGLKTVP